MSVNITKNGKIKLLGEQLTNITNQMPSLKTDNLQFWFDGTYGQKSSNITTWVDRSNNVNANLTGFSFDSNSGWLGDSLASGGNGVVTIPYGANLQTSDTFTIEVSCIINKLGVGSIQPLIAKSSSSSSYEFVLGIDGTGKLMASVYSSSYDDLQQVIDLGKRYTFALRYSKNGKTDLFVNGILVKSMSSKYFTSTSTNIQLFGLRTNRIDANMYYCRMYNTALTNQELKNNNALNNNITSIENHYTVNSNGQSTISSDVNPNWTNWSDNVYGYGMDKNIAPVFNSFHGVVMTDSFFIVRGGLYSRWGFHVFEGYGAEPRNRLTMLAGKHANMAEIYYYNTDTLQYLPVRIGSDNDGEGIDVNNKTAISHVPVTFEKDVILTSPSGKKYALRVADDGVLSTVLIP